MGMKLCDSDFYFMCVVWDEAPVRSGELVKLCRERLGWKKSTTYTQIKKLQEKGFLKNEDAVVTALISREEVQKEESDYFVERTFGGSLPGFLAAFMKGRTISGQEAEQIKKMIEEHSVK
jgi:Predicted transcriptional regulator